MNTFIALTKRLFKPYRMLRTAFDQQGFTARTHSVSGRLTLRVLALTAGCIFFSTTLIAQTPDDQGDIDGSADGANAESETPPPPKPLVRYYKSVTEQTLETQQRLAKTVDNGTSGLSSDKANAVWLQAADEEFVGILTPAATAKTAGTVLLIHDDGQHPLWPGSLLNLQNYLPEKGWATFAIAVPEQIKPDPPAPPTEEELAEHTTVSKITTASSQSEDPESDGSQSQDTESETEGADDTETTANQDGGSEDNPVAGDNEDKEIFDDTNNTVSDGGFVPVEEITEAKPKKPADEIEVQTQDRIIAAINHLQSNGSDVIVLLGEGLGALRASNYLQETTAPVAMRGMILINAINKMVLPIQEDDNNDATTTKTFLITDSFGNPDFPIFDVISDASLPYTTNTLSPAQLLAKARSDEAKRQGLRKYRQQSLANTYDDAFLTRVYGFLKTHCQ